MKLNHDCIRAVLLYLENELNLARDERGGIRWAPIPLKTLAEHLPAYSEEDIFYTLHNLNEAGLIECNIQYASGRTVYRCDVFRITFAGHEFLEKIRDEDRWGKAKGILDAVRNYSLDAISSVASGITAAAIDARLPGRLPPRG